VLLKLGKLDGALAAYNQAVAKGTGADSLMGRAMVYARKGDRAHAEVDASAARKLWPDATLVFAGDYGLKLDDDTAKRDDGH
jgi:Flp pilus assembly protein TadD